jgi:two-component system, chemotaxis family, protein-glutamate methylesterase/glutaminase
VTYDVVVVGASLGGLRAMNDLLESLPEQMRVPMVLAQHRAPDSERDSLETLLQRHTHLTVREAGDKDRIEPGHLYVAPPDYHLLVEDGHFALSVDARVQFARPSIDVLFESVAEAYRDRAIGIVLTGSNEDGAAGLAAIKRNGGVSIVQDPHTAEKRAMPDAAIAGSAADAVLPLDEIGPFLYGLCRQ